MSQVNISYKTAKALKEFLRGSCPYPLKEEYWQDYPPNVPLCPYIIVPMVGDTLGYPAYQLHDLLSKPFCEAMANKLKIPELYDDQWEWEDRHHKDWEFFYDKFSEANKDGGLPAVEKALEEMMK